MAGETQWTVTCVCGWRVQGSRDEVIVAVQDHGRVQHGLESTADQVMAQARPVTPP